MARLKTDLRVHDFPDSVPQLKDSSCHVLSYVLAKTVWDYFTKDGVPVL